MPNTGLHVLLQPTNESLMWGGVFKYKTKNLGELYTQLRPLCVQFFLKKSLWRRDVCRGLHRSSITSSLGLFTPSFILWDFKCVKPLMWVPRPTHSKLCIISLKHSFCHCKNENIVYIHFGFNSGFNSLKNKIRFQFWKLDPVSVWFLWIRSQKWRFFLTKGDTRPTRIICTLFEFWIDCWIWCIF